MNARANLLVAALVIVGIALLGDQSYRAFVEEPAGKRERTLSRLRKEVQKAEDVIFQSAAAADELLALEQFSLPHDEELARARYQEWLLILVEEAGLEQPAVDSGAAVPITVRGRDKKKPKEIGKRYPFSVRGRGTLQQITQLLFSFYQAGHLQKIRSLALNPVAGGTQLDVTTSIEALSLTRCERSDGLPEETANRLAFDDWEAYRSIARRNLFLHRGDSELRQAVLTAVTFDRAGTPEAWFSLGSEKRTQRIQRGESLSLLAHEVRVIDIQPELALVEVDGAIIHLPLGKSIHDMSASLEKPKAMLPLAPTAE